MQTRRLAAVNLDWDHVRAVDLFKVFASALSPSTSAGGSSTAAGRVVRVAVYPSDFGRERMAREELEGPPQELFKPVKDDEPEPARLQDGDEYDERALRKYQLERLRCVLRLCDRADSADTTTPSPISAPSPLLAASSTRSTAPSSRRRRISSACARSRTT